MLIDAHENIASKTYWAQLREIKIEDEQREILNWIQMVLAENPIPKEVIALWIGILKFAADDDKEIPTIYFVGADDYHEEEIDWTFDPTYLPDNRYAQPNSLSQIDDIIKSDAANYEFLDWLLPLAYCAFTFDEIIRTKLDKRISPTSQKEIFVTLGHDSGDHVNLSSLHS